MPRPNYKPTEEERRTVKTMAACGMRQEQMAAKLDIAPKTLRKHFGQELTLGAAEALLAIRKTLFSMATSGRNIAATIYADKTWSALCARHSETGGQPVPPPQIVIRVEGQENQSGEGGPER